MRMARLLPGDFSMDQGSLEIEELFPNCVEVYFQPSLASIRDAGLDIGDVVQYRKLILTMSGQDNFMEIKPIFTLPTHRKFLQPKYQQITSITLLSDFGNAPETTDEVLAILESLPSGFVKDFQYGLGFNKDYQFIINSIEEVCDCSELIMGSSETAIDDGVFYLNFTDFDEMRKLCNRITEKARRTARTFKSGSVYNWMAYRLDMEQKPLPTTNEGISKFSNIQVSPSDITSAVSLVTQNRKSIKVSEPEQLLKLREDIELVSLEKLIENFEELLGKKTREDTWQNLFNENPFILTLAFGFPAVMISGQASVGGRTIHGKGDKITDFLIKNDLSNNLAVFEIKKPSSKLLSKKQYRENIFAPANELSGSVNQVLDQRYQLQKSINSLKVDSLIYDIESYAVHCVLIIGTMPNGEYEKKSFELYRQNFKDVQIITFDELLEKLKQLHRFLSEEGTE